MQKAYTRIVWENYPSIETPIDEINLNRMDSALDTVDSRVVAMDTTKAAQSDLLQSLKTVSYNDQTGLFTFTWWNGTTVTIDLNIEKIPVSFSMSEQGVITMTTADGTQYTADVASLIKTYTFVDSSTIDVTVTTDASGNKTVTAGIIDGSITESKLQPNFLSDCRAQVQAATTQAGLSLDSARESEAWAVGEKNGVPVTSEADQYENHSKYYATQASGYAQTAEDMKDAAQDILDEIEVAAGNVVFSVNFATGNLEYTNTSLYTFSINTTTGNLEWEVVV